MLSFGVMAKKPFFDHCSKHFFAIFGILKQEGRRDLKAISQRLLPLWMM